MKIFLKPYRIVVPFQLINWLWKTTCLNGKFSLLYFRQCIFTGKKSLLLEGSHGGADDRKGTSKTYINCNSPPPRLLSCITLCLKVLNVYSSDNKFLLDLWFVDHNNSTRIVDIKLLPWDQRKRIAVLLRPSNINNLILTIPVIMVLY